jgi:hypothetical protein
VDTTIAVVEKIDFSLTEIVSSVARTLMQAAPVPEASIEVEIEQHDD